MPDSMSAEASSITLELLKLDPSDRLGFSDGVAPSGSSNLYSSIRSHPFLLDFDWKGLKEGTLSPPYTPPSSAAWMHCKDEELIDGEQELESYFLEGDATPLLVVPTRLPASDVVKGEGHNSKKKGLLSLDEDSWQRFIPSPEEHEQVIKSGSVAKRKGFFTKSRVLILTNKPRLIYVDPDSMVYKGTIPWTKETPVRVKRLSEVKFDVIATKDGGEERAYHLSDLGGDCGHWVEAILSMLT